MSGRIRLRLLATSDLHAHLTSFDYLADRLDPALGLQAAGRVIAAAREEAANCLFVDNGDLLQGGPLGDAVAEGFLAGDAHPMVAALAALGCDAATLGNHEFDFGLDLLGAAVEAAPFPFVASNIRFTGGGPKTVESLVLERDCVDEGGAVHRLRIGVLGFLPPQVAQWNRLALAGRVEVEDIAAAARRLGPALREHCDLVIALAHTGLSRRAPVENEENAGRTLAALGIFDGIVLGHQHLLFPGPAFADLAEADIEGGKLAGVPAVMPGYAGGHVGVIDWDLAPGNGHWRPVSAKASLRGSGIPALPARAGGFVHEKTLAFVARPAGHLAGPVTSHFALVADSAAVQIVNDAQRWYLRDHLHELGLSDLPLLSAAAPFRCGGRGGPGAYTRVSPGPVTLRDIAAIYPFPNALCVVRVNGAGLAEWLERSACLFRRIDTSSSRPQMLHDPAHPSFDFDVIDGISYAIDATRDARYDGAGTLIAPDSRRIVNLTFAGAPVREGDDFLVATNNYRAFGGGAFPGLDGGSVVFVAPEPCRDVLARYVAAHPGLDPRPDDHWRLTPFEARLDIRFLSAPDAPEDPRWTPIERTPEGFGLFRMTAEVKNDVT